MTAGREKVWKSPRRSTQGHTHRGSPSPPGLSNGDMHDRTNENNNPSPLPGILDLLQLQLIERGSRRTSVAVVYFQERGGEIRRSGKASRCNRKAHQPTFPLPFTSLPFPLLPPRPRVQLQHRIAIPAQHHRSSRNASQVCRHLCPDVPSLLSLVRACARASPSLSARFAISLLLARFELMKEWGPGGKLPPGGRDGTASGRRSRLFDLQKRKRKTFCSSYVVYRPGRP